MADNRGYRYGDGLFETMKVLDGKILLEKYHFERLFSGAKLMKFRLPSSITAKKLRQNILALCKKNHCMELARVRLSLSRGQGGLYDKKTDAQYIIECTPADSSVNRLNENGLTIDIFPDAQKSCDSFSNLKSANYLPYIMAAEYAKENKVDDCLIYNVMGRIADSTIANIFLVKNNLIITPSLEEGCVNGVVRRYLLEKIRAAPGPFELREGVVTKNDMDTFQEIFLTNSMYGIRSVKQYRDKIYSNKNTMEIYRQYIAPLYS